MSKKEQEPLPEPRIQTDEDFDEFIRLAEEDKGWDLCFDEKGIKVWDQKLANSDINTVKVRTIFKDIEALALYDVFHDAEYRREWDENMIDGQEFEELDKNNDIGYYSVRCPNPLTNRDFVNQRAWRVKGNTYLCAFSSFFPLIFYFFFFFFFLSSHLYYLFHSHFDSLGYVIKNHSVNYPKCPEKKNFIRARSIRTGYYVVALESGGCQLIYMTQSDPKGAIPSFISNTVTKKLAPKIVGKIEKAAKEYPAWKAKHNPEKHPWRD